MDVAYTEDKCKFPIPKKLKFLAGKKIRLLTWRQMKVAFAEKIIKNK